MRTINYDEFVAMVHNPQNMRMHIKFDRDAAGVPTKAQFAIVFKAPLGDRLETVSFTLISSPIAALSGPGGPVINLSYRCRQNIPKGGAALDPDDADKILQTVGEMMHGRMEQEVIKEVRHAYQAGLLVANSVH